MTRPWWHDTVIYHIYPRSFYDANGDGYGDLPGIIEKLPYLRDLGIGAIWMGPVFSSPQVDNGYDVSDYRRIDPLFGTNADMDRLIESADRHGIRVLLDLVFNHSSDRHPWFEASRSRPAGKYGDYYIWRDAAPDGSEPNEWRSVFGGSAWDWSEDRHQFYLHLFAREQPDLNWENPAVRAELRDIANYWLDRGVAGFRMDVINFISKSADDYIDGPRFLEFIAEFRAGLRNGGEVLLVGETPGINAERAAAYTDPDAGALDMVLLFDHLRLDHGPGGRWDPVPWRHEDLRRNMEYEQRLLKRAWPSIYLSNHDQPRIVSRYGNEQEYRYESATALATVFYLQRGTPILYQGDEIAMRNIPIEEATQIVDIESGNAYRELVQEKGLSPEEALRRVRRIARDNGRTPMQWSGADNAGFTPRGATASPWYPVNPDYPEWNVAAQDESGTVRWYIRELLALRRDDVTLRHGEFELVHEPEDSPVVAYRRRRVNGTVLVVANLSDGVVGFPFTNGSILLSNYSDSPVESTSLLRPWECRVLAENLHRVGGIHTMTVEKT